MNTLIDIIKQRHSCRSYQIRKIDSLTKSELQSYIHGNSKGLRGEEIKIDIIEKDFDSTKEMKLDYVIISNHSSYIVGKVGKDSASRMSYGFVAEKVVLKATALGLDSCWVGYFDPEFFSEIEISSELEIPSIVVLGYATKTKLSDKFIRFSVGSRRRKEWSQIFFVDNFSTPLLPTRSGTYKGALEMLRLAPSSGNTQPWRVIMESNGEVFHFYKKIISPRYEAKGLHDIDMGIALAHFELTAKQYGLSGKWEQIEHYHHSEFNGNVKYMVSWIGV